MEKYSCNRNVFKEIKTEKEAYWLGFILADGHNHKNKRIRVDIKDKNHLEDLSMLIYPNNDKPVKTRDLGFGTVYYFDCSILDVVENLASYGIVPNKSKIATLPEIPDDMYNHFIRGVYDGDGCLSFTYEKKSKNYRRYCFSIVGSDELMKGIKDTVKNQIGIDLGYGNMKTIKRVYKKGNQQIMSILFWLYQNSSVYLQRKYEKYQDMLNYYKLKI
jgi:hypothetical protein